MEYTKPVMWDGKSPLVGDWHFTVKIDGIRVLINDMDVVVSRNNKPLYNMDHLKAKIKASMPEGCEVFLGTFKATVEAVRTKRHYKPVPESALFTLNPIDPRLDICTLHSPSVGAVWQLYKKQLKAKHEGLVARNDMIHTWLKIKKYETVDTEIIGFYGGKKGTKYEEMLGGFITKHGRVGTGITDEERVKWWRKSWNGVYKHVPTGKAPIALYAVAKGHPLYATMVECRCMEITAAGKMRKPRFVRLRPDK